MCSGEVGAAVPIPTRPFASTVKMFVEVAIVKIAVEEAAVEVAIITCPLLLIPNMSVEVEIANKPFAKELVVDPITNAPVLEERLRTAVEEVYVKKLSVCTTLEALPPMKNGMPFTKIGVEVVTPPEPPAEPAMVYVPLVEVVIVMFAPAVNPIVEVETNAPPFAKKVTVPPPASAEQVIVPVAEMFDTLSVPPHAPPGLILNPSESVPVELPSVNPGVDVPKETTPTFVIVFATLLSPVENVRADSFAFQVAADAILPSAKVPIHVGTNRSCPVEVVICMPRFVSEEVAKVKVFPRT